MGISFTASSEVFEKLCRGHNEREARFMPIKIAA